MKLGCTGFVGTGLLLTTLFVVAIRAPITGFFTWRTTVNQAAIVTAQETGLTERTQIEWSARTEIARIQADVDKKTSGNFVLFFAVRAALWAGYLLLGAVALGIGGWFAARVIPVRT